jgi:putative FmdB family regulatory protein
MVCSFRRKSMPFYEFQCPEGTITESLVPMGTETIKCPKCHKKAKKIMSPCTFKLAGGGWYADGYSSTAKGTKKDSAKRPKEKFKTE